MRPPWPRIVGERPSRGYARLRMAPLRMRAKNALHVHHRIEEFSMNATIHLARLLVAAGLGGATGGAAMVQP